MWIVCLTDYRDPATLRTFAAGQSYEVDGGLASWLCRIAPQCFAVGGRAPDAPSFDKMIREPQEKK